MPAASSLPVPLSPSTSTVEVVAATRSSSTCNFWIAGERPIISPWTAGGPCLAAAPSCWRSRALSPIALTSWAAHTNKRRASSSYAWPLARRTSRGPHST